MTGWGFVPDPDRWPAKVASYLSIARARLRSPGDLLLWGDFFVACLREEDIEGDPQRLWQDMGDDRLRLAEVEFLAGEAFARMVADGEASGAGSRSPQYLNTLAGALDWDQPGSYFENQPQALRPTTRLLEMDAAEWEQLGTWSGVDALVQEVRQAYAHGLYVAAAAAARVAAEQAVLEALTALGPEDDGRPHAREVRLFEALRPDSFRGQPMDHSAARAQLSAVRALGNTAAHDGAVRSAAVQEALMRLLPQALVSLFNAVLASSP